MYSHRMSLSALWWAGCDTLLSRISAMTQKKKSFPFQLLWSYLQLLFHAWNTKPSQSWVAFNWFRNGVCQEFSRIQECEWQTIREDFLACYWGVWTVYVVKSAISHSVVTVYCWVTIAWPPPSSGVLSCVRLGFYYVRYHVIIPIPHYHACQLGHPSSFSQLITP